MDNKPRTTPKDFFLHLGVIITLYATVAALLRLVFSVLNYAMPEQLESSYYMYDPYSAAVSISIAVLIIIFPLYILFSWLLNRDYAAYPEKRALGVRRWLTYITLFLAGIVIVVDLVTLLYSFLQGEEITGRFILKVLAVLLVAGAVFWYYIIEVIRDNGWTSRGRRSFAIGSAVAVLAVIVLGFLVLGSPAYQKNRRLDNRRVSDLNSIYYGINSYVAANRSLPNSLSQLENTYVFDVPEDPATNQPYEYRVLSSGSYELCATFATESDPRTNESIVSKEIQSFYSHGEGRQCFTLNVDVNTGGVPAAFKR